MKYTLNQAGQTAIVKWLAEINCSERPWRYFDLAEMAHNRKRKQIEHLATLEALPLEASWFDTAPEPATFDEVVAMLRRIKTHWYAPPSSVGGLTFDVDQLLERCPKE